MCQRRYAVLLLISLLLCVYSPVYAQEATEGATPPVEAPTEAPTEQPTEAPSEPPTEAPTEVPTEPATEQPTEAPTVENTVEATAEVTVEATLEATQEATVAPPTAPPVPTRELLVNFNPAATQQALSDMLATLDGVELERIPQIGAMRVLVPDTVGTPDLAMGRLRANPSTLQAAGVLNVEYNGTRQLAGFTPNDPSLGLQWGILDVDGNSPDGDLGSMWVHSTTGTGAWDIATPRGTGVTVAVLDTGVDLQHPDLMGQIVAGWDFTWDDNVPDDNWGHGTHVAGIIAARTNNGIGIAGVAPNAKIMPVKICDPYCEWFDIAAGIVFAADRGAKVINLSLGGCGGATTVEQGAIQYALARNVVVVASAGNGVSPSCSDPSEYFYPASYDGVISVAMHRADSLSCGDNFTNTFAPDPLGLGCNHNDRILVSAPGYQVYSTWPTNIFPYNYRLLDGTSMAAPHVSGVVALFLSISTMPKTPAAAREALICSAYDDPDSPPGRDDYIGYGLVQADKAVNWNGNSATCQVSLPNDNFETPTVIGAAPYNATAAVNPRSVTSQVSDPDLTADPDCPAPAASPQTLWWRYRPTATGVYQITTFGSSFDTVVGVFQGTQGALSKVGCNDDSGVGFGNGESLLTVPLQAATTYYLMAQQFDAPVNGGVLALNVRLSAAANNVDVQENSPYIHYSGSWARIPLTGASGGYVNQTTDSNALAIFSFRGTNLDLSRTIGPDRGDLEVWVDGTQWDFDLVTGGTQNLSNRAALAKTNQAVNINVSGNGGTWHQVVLRRDATGSAGPVDFDRFRPHEAVGVPTTVVTAWADDRAASLIYSGSWVGTAGNIQVPGSYAGTANFSSTAGDTVTGRLRGTAIGIYRNTNLTIPFGPMDVFVDGQFYTTIDNDGVTGVQVPYWITGLVATDHVVQIVNTAGGDIQFDAFYATASAPLALNSKIDDRVATLRYSGIWTNTAMAGAYLSTLKTTSDPDARVEFLISGNHFCVGYRRSAGASGVEVFVDNVSVGSFSTAGTTANQVEWCSLTNGGLNPFADGNHWVRLEKTAAGGALQIDYVRSLRYNVIVPGTVTVHDTDPRFLYSGVWYNLPAIYGTSGGGYPPQGSTIRYTEMNGASVTFYVNGSGFILYTAATWFAGWWRVEVDGAVLPILFLGDTPPGCTTPQDVIDMFYPWDPRVQGIGITGLAPGIHKVRLVALTNGLFCDPVYDGYIYPIYFDGIRVFP